MIKWHSRLFCLSWHTAQTNRGGAHPSRGPFGPSRPPDRLGQPRGPACVVTRVSGRADTRCVPRGLFFSRLHTCGGFWVPHVPRIFFPAASATAVPGEDGRRCWHKGNGCRLSALARAAVRLELSALRPVLFRRCLSAPCAFVRRPPCLVRPRVRAWGERCHCFLSWFWAGAVCPRTTFI